MPPARKWARRQIEHQQILPRPGWVEHDPIEIAARVDEVIAGALANGWTDGRDWPPSASPTSARRRSSGTQTGRPWHNAIVWQDTRTAELVATLSRSANGSSRRPGFRRPPTSPSLKLRWMLDNVGGPARGRRRGRALFGTVDTLGDLESDWRPTEACTSPTSPTPAARS